MHRFIFSVFILIMLSACTGTNQDFLAMPSPVEAQTATSTISPSETPIPTPTPVPLSLVLADFPLAVGATWEYAAEISYQDPADVMKRLTWSGTVTDEIVDKRIEADGKIVFTVQESLEPKPPEQVWRQSGTFEYIVWGDGVFKRGLKVYQYPLGDRQKWQAFADFGYEMMVQHRGEVVTLYGRLENCYTFFLATNPDTSIDTFCKGIGFVEHAYRHHGTPQDENFILSSFTPGQ